MKCEKQEHCRSAFWTLARFNCLRKYRRLDAFLTTSNTCLFQETEERLLVIVTPSNLGGGGVTLLRSLRKKNFFTGWEDWPHAQPSNLEGQGFLLVWPSLISQSFVKAPDDSPYAVVAQLQWGCITRVMMRISNIRLGGRAYDTVAIFQHYEIHCSKAG